jgi:hypothetical protein
MRCVIPILILCAALPAWAQRAQLPAKGRKQENTPSKAEQGPRKLPRQGPGAGERKFPKSALEQKIEEERARVVPRVVPEDRTRDVVKPQSAAPSALASEAAVSPYARPKRPEGGDPLAGKLPSFVMGDPGPDARYLNRWRIPFPAWKRYTDKKLDIVYAKQRLWDPYNRNVLKGDYPFWGREWFMNVAVSSETLTEMRRIPVPSPASASDAGSFDFFAKGEQFTLRESIRPSIEIFKGSAAFKPVDLSIRITPEFNFNRNIARDNGILNIDVRQGFQRDDSHVGLQEAFVEVRLGTNSTKTFRRARNADDRGSAYFDFTALRAGIQRFTSDFRGFVFVDEQPGARLFGTFHNNVFQYNLAYFHMLEKDTNSFLNTFSRRNQSVYVANMYWNDFLTEGYNLNFSALYNNDQPRFLLDNNGFLVRPAPIGTPIPNKVRVGYVGVSGDGHIKRYNISHAFYQAFGSHDFNVIAGKRQHINAQLAALELSYEKDWKTYRLSGFFTSGDKDIRDGKAGGFDAIVPNQQFAGGGFLGNNALSDRGLINPAFGGGGTNFLNRQPVPLTGTSTILFGPNSLIPSMRAGLVQGQANFVNPGVILINAGYDAKLTPKWKLTSNVNYVRFHRTAVLEAVLFQAPIHHAIGIDTGLGAQYRPLLNDNIVFTGGFGFLAPMRGFKDIYSGRSLLSGFVSLRLFF